MSVQDLKILYLTDTEPMGRLIMTFARDPASRPRTIEALNQMLLDENVVPAPTQADIDNKYEPHWPNGRPTTLRYLPPDDGDVAGIDDDDVLMIRIPTLTSLEAGRQLAEQLTANATYPFPAGYDSGYDGSPVRRKLAPDDWDRFYLTRIGDYCIGKCM